MRISRIGGWVGGVSISRLGGEPNRLGVGGGKGFL